MTNVQVACSGEELNKLLGRVRSYWESIWQDEAFWSVITQPRYKKDQLQDNLDAFYESGRGVVEQALGHVQGKAPRRALDFGCGTGRVSLHLSKACESLVSCDISLPHLKLAEEHLSERGVDNIEYRQVMEPADLEDGGTFDLIFSVIALQHSPPPVIGEYIDRFCSLLAPEGIAFFQVPTHIDGYSYDVAEDLRRKGEVMEMHMIPARHVHDIAAKHGCRIVEQIEQDMVGSATVRSEVFVLRRG